MERIQYRINIKENGPVTKVQQIVAKMVRDIENGVLAGDVCLPSINKFSRHNGVARDTVEKAYVRLKEKGYLISVPGKGNFVKPIRVPTKKILMVLNSMGPCKMAIFEAFTNTLGEDFQVEIQIHHGKPALFANIMEANLGKYHYYVVMPHFPEHIAPSVYLNVLNRVPSDELIVLDKCIDIDKDHICIYQDFQRDVYTAFSLNEAFFKKYNRLFVVSTDHLFHSSAIIKGIEKFCETRSLPMEVITSIEDKLPARGDVFVILNEVDLASTLKSIRELNLTLGKDVGLISFNETMLKDLLEITVVSTDFVEMGRTAAELLLARKTGKIKNSFSFIKRGSL